MRIRRGPSNRQLKRVLRESLGYQESLALELYRMRQTQAAQSKQSPWLIPAPYPQSTGSEQFDRLDSYLYRHIEWSERVLGHGPHTEGLLKHIAKELDEIREHPSDLLEWVDVLILAFDGAWRAGYSVDQILLALQEKQNRNFKRTWVMKGEDEPIEHDRTGSEG